MNWKQEGSYITTEGPLRASVKRRLDKYVVRVGGLSAHQSCATEEEAKQFGEEQLQIAKRAFILSLITKFSDDIYMFGKDVIQIIGDQDDWGVYNAGCLLFKGNLEECKNYIAECF